MGIGQSALVARKRGSHGLIHVWEIRCLVGRMDGWMDGWLVKQYNLMINDQ